MKHTNFGTRLTLWVNRLVGLTVGALVFFLPRLIAWYCQFRVLTPTEQTAITIAFYGCVLLIAPALWCMDRLLLRILDGQVFIRENVRRIRVVCGCCGGVSLICIPAACAYLPLVFLVIIMAFLALVVSVVAGVMDAAVTIREENDLTI